MPPRGSANLAPYDVQRTVANHLHAPDGALVMVHTLRSHANVQRWRTMLLLVFTTVSSVPYAVDHFVPTSSA